MPYIAPNSTVYLLHDVPLDSSYHHSIFWSSAQRQAQWFQGKCIANGAFSNLAYARASTGIIRVQQIADALYPVNYMMYRNTSYGSKWFYAFVDEVIYLNDNTTEIRFTIDHLQTWFFETNFRPCLVERNHASVDTPGSSITDEPVQTGPIRCVNVYKAVDLSSLDIVVAYAGSSGSDGGGDGDDE